MKSISTLFTRLKLSNTIMITVAILMLLAQKVRCFVEEIDVNQGKKEVGEYQVARFNFKSVSTVYLIMLWVILGSLAKICNKKKTISISLDT